MKGLWSFHARKTTTIVSRIGCNGPKGKAMVTQHQRRTGEKATSPAGFLWLRYLYRLSGKFNTVDAGCKQSIVESGGSIIDQEYPGGSLLTFPANTALPLAIVNETIHYSYIELKWSGATNTNTLQWVSRRK